MCSTRGTGGAKPFSTLVACASGTNAARTLLSLYSGRLFTSTAAMSNWRDTAAAGHGVVGGGGGVAAGALLLNGFKPGTAPGRTRMMPHAPARKRRSTEFM